MAVRRSGWSTVGLGLLQSMLLAWSLLLLTGMCAGVWRVTVAAG